MKRDGHAPILKHSRWRLLKRPENRTDQQTAKLRELMKHSLRTVRAYLMKEMTGTLRRHRSLLLNWFAAKGELSSGSVEGMNTKAKVALRKSYGFKTDEVYETVPYHELGRLPEHELAHQFC